MSQVVGCKLLLSSLSLAAELPSLINSFCCFFVPALCDHMIVIENFQCLGTNIDRMMHMYEKFYVCKNSNCDNCDIVVYDNHTIKNLISILLIPTC